MHSFFPYDQVAAKLVIALGIGLFVGLEREWAQKAAGVRTFAITAMLGAVAALIGYSAVIAVFAAVAALAVLLNVNNFSHKEPLEITTSVALLATLALGVLTGQGHYFTATAAAVLMTLLLSHKVWLSKFADKLRPEEIRSAVLIGLLTFVIYPLMPHSFVDPWRLIDPQEIWAIVVVIAGLGFFNYVMLRVYGTRGIYYSAFLGGLVNSTATAAEMSASSGTGEAPPLPPAALLLTSAAMFVRNLAILAIFAPGAVPSALPALGVMALIAVPFVWSGWKSDSLSARPLELSSPLSLVRVFEFAALFIAMMCVGTLGQRYLGSFGFLALSLLGGIVSSASTTATAASLVAAGTITPEIAGAAAVIASIMSALVTIPIVRKISPQTALGRVFAVSAVMVFAGLTLLALTNRSVLALIVR